jgi:hypothetical protein
VRQQLLQRSGQLRHLRLPRSAAGVSTAAAACLQRVLQLLLQLLRPLRGLLTQLGQLHEGTLVTARSRRSVAAQQHDNMTGCWWHLEQHRPTAEQSVRALHHAVLPAHL